MTSRRRALGALAAFALGAPLFAAAPAPPATGFDAWSIYHVYLATYRNGDRANDGAFSGWRDPNYAGGDLAGLAAALDHIRDLGATAIWVSPMFAAVSSHGYDVTNYFAIGDAVGVAGDPAAGLALWRRLRDEAHARGLAVVLDLPLNHAARRYDLRAGDPHDLGPKATGARQPAERLWESWNAGYRYWNFDHAGTREFLKRVALHWLVDEGADGLRLDYVRGVPLDFWQELAAAVAVAAPGKLLLGECWADEAGAASNVDEIARYALPAAGGRAFDAMLDFPLQATLVDVLAGRAPADRLEEILRREEAAWGGGAAAARFLDNHDLARFVDRVGDRRGLEAGLALAASLTGPLVLFYGTETALGGGPATAGFTDGGRLPMPWERIDAAALAATRSILELRRHIPALSTGRRLPLLADRDTLAFAKVDAGAVALVALHAGRSPREIALDLATLPTDAEGARSVHGEATVAVDRAAGRLRWTLPPRSTSILLLGIETVTEEVAAWLAAELSPALAGRAD